MQLAEAQGLSQVRSKAKHESQAARECIWSSFLITAKHFYTPD